MTIPLAVTVDDLGRLSSDRAVDLFRELLWAEAARCGIARNLINVPTAITVSDGGVDAEVEAAAPVGGQGIIKKGITRYQIKTGPFSLSGVANVQDILFKPKKTGSDTRELNTRIKSCFDKDGTLVVVLFGWDSPDTEDGKVVKTFKEELGKVSTAYPDAKIEIWRQNQLGSFLQPYPSLRLKLLGVPIRPFSTHETWSQLADMQHVLKVGQPQQQFIDNLQAAMREVVNPVHVRVIQEPGVGKTRLVLEALRAADLSPLTLYCQSPKNVLESDLLSHMLIKDSEANCILVIDECDASNRADLWNQLKAFSPRIKVVTIYSEPDTATGTTTYLNPPALAAAQIAEIIASYGFPSDQAERWVSFCDGSPRAAHIFGANLRANPDDLLQSPDTVPVWSRYIAGTELMDSPTHQDRLRVLRWLSLFKRFGYGTPYQEEGRLIAKKIEQMEGMPLGRFQQVINDLRNRKILQGDTTLYITPKILHIWLWTQWWKVYGSSEKFDLDAFQTIDPSSDPPTKLNDQLIEWFYEMYRYAAASDVAAGVVHELLDRHGPFDFGFLNTRQGSQFFRFLTESDPKSALACLRRVLGPLDAGSLSAFAAGRRQVVNALEMICMWRELFPAGARLLLALGEAENESWSNNASGVFAGLFSPGFGAVAPSEASPKERLPVLLEALGSPSKGRRSLGLRACAGALETRHFSRIAGAEYQGLRRMPAQWKPETYGEMFDAYRPVWTALAEEVDKLEGEEQQQAVKILLDHTRGLSLMGDLGLMVTESIEGLVQRYPEYRQPVLETVAQVLHYEGKNLPDEVRQRWEALREALTGEDFPALMERYVSMALMVDQFDEQGKYVDQAQSKIESLAGQAASEPALLEAEIPWLVTPKAKEGYRFGYELGRRDDGFTLLPRLLEAQKKATEPSSTFFLGGYFRALREADIMLWEETLDGVVEDPDLDRWLLDLTWRSGSLTDRSARRVLSAILAGICRTAGLQVFALGSVITHLSEGAFLEWVDHLLSLMETSYTSICLDLFYAYYFPLGTRRGLPQEATLRLLAHPTLFEDASSAGQGQMAEFYWTEIAKRYVEDHPEASLPLAGKMLENFGNASSVAGGLYSSTRQVLDDISARFPVEVWEMVAQHLDTAMGTNSYYLGLWLHGEELFASNNGATNGPPPAGKVGGSLDLFPRERIWQWVDEDADGRAWHLAHVVPKILRRDGWKGSMARETLVRYGNRDDVRNELLANYWSGGWTGPESLHWEQVKAEILSLRREEDNANVLLWMEDFVASLDRDIKTSRAREERRN